MCLRATRLDFIMLDFLVSLQALASSVIYLVCFSVQLWVWSDRTEGLLS